MKKLVVAGFVVAVLCSPAGAGGFAAREQSAEFQGMSFAGAAASGGGLSGMFWNPAIVGFAPRGIQAEFHGAGIFGHTDVSGNLFAGGVNIGLPTDSGNLARSYFLPSGYVSFRGTENLVFAVSVNSPFRSEQRERNHFWAGQTANGARRFDIDTINITPTLAYQILPNLSVGFGVQIQSIKFDMRSASGVTPTSLDLVTKAENTDYGITAGINWLPVPGTSVGLGYRSSIRHGLSGHISIPDSPVAPAAAGVPVRFALATPDIVTLSVRHHLSERLKVLATVEWSHWHRLSAFDIVCANNAVPNAVFCPAGGGQLVRSVRLNWQDGWMFAGGLEYDYSPTTTVRTGIAYERSPIQSAEQRWLGGPDTDRLWASVGASYRWSNMLAFDIAYSHVFGVGNGDISRFESGVTFVGDVNAHVDIVSVSAKVKLQP